VSSDLAIIIISRVLQSLQIPAIWLRRHPLRGVDSVRLQILLMGTCRQCGSGSVAGHNHKRWLGETPFMQVSMTCPETVHQRPRVTREIETWLSDSRVGNSSVVDHRPWTSALRLNFVSVGYSETRTVSARLVHNTCIPMRPPFTVKFANWSSVQFSSCAVDKPLVGRLCDYWWEETRMWQLYASSSVPL